MAIADGTVCSVQFAPDQGVSISRQGQVCGTISDAELSEIASRRNGAMELAAQIEEMPGQQAPMMSSQDALMNTASNCISSCTRKPRSLRCGIGPCRLIRPRSSQKAESDTWRTRYRPSRIPRTKARADFCAKYPLGSVLVFSAKLASWGKPTSVGAVISTALPGDTHRSIR